MFAGSLAFPACPKHPSSPKLRNFTRVGKMGGKKGVSDVVLRRAPWLDEFIGLCGWAVSFLPHSNRFGFSGVDGGQLFGLNAYAFCVEVQANF